MKVIISIFLAINIVSLSVFIQKKELMQSIERGKSVYDDFCIQCHLHNGKGVEGIYPPLANSDYLTKNIDKSIRAVKFGMKGPIVVNGIKYDNVMANQDLLNEEVADVMNYILHSWGNKSKEYITTKRVDSIRIK